MSGSDPDDGDAPPPYPADDLQHLHYGLYRRSLPWAAAAAVVVVIGGGAYAVTRSVEPPTCPKRYAAWKAGPAGAIVDGPLAIEIDAAQTAWNNQDVPKADSALSAVGQRLDAYPMPACADPYGYWPRYLAELWAANVDAGSVPGIAGVAIAQDAMQQLKPTIAKLDAELARTVGARDGA